MMMRSIAFAAAIAAFSLHPAHAEDGTFTIGGDQYRSGYNATLGEPSARDALLTGFSATLDAKADKDVNAAGFDVEINAPVGQDLYAAGMTVNVNAPVGADLVLAGANIRVNSAATIGGNSRIIGANAVIDAPLTGSLVAAAGSVTLDGTVKGDVNIKAQTLVFGPNAKIDGVLTYSAPNPITIPTSVISAERVHFIKMATVVMPMQAFHNATDRIPGRFHIGRGNMVFGFIFSTLFLLLIGAALFNFAPKLTDKVRGSAGRAPLKSIVAGIVGLALLIGAIPVSCMTLVGIPLIPFIILAIMVFWGLGYLFGVMTVTARVASAFGRQADGIWSELIQLAIGLLAFAILNFIPFLGWLINLLAVFLGMGVIVTWGIRRLALWLDLGSDAGTPPMSPDEAAETGHA
jgi:hypothetical protein